MTVETRAESSFLIISLIVSMTALAQAAPAQTKKQRKPPGEMLKQNTEAAVFEQSKLKDDLPAEAKAATEKKLEQLDAKAEQILAENPQDGLAQHGGAQYFLQRGDYKAAAGLADKALSLGSSRGNPQLTAKVLITRGLARYESGDISAAHADGAAAVKLDPQSRSALELFMYTQGRAEKLESVDLKVRLVALQALGRPHTPEQWAKRQKENPTALAELIAQSMKNYKEGKLASALRFAEAAVKTDPGDPMAYAQRGLIRRDTGEYEGAILDLSRALHMGWQWDPLYTVRGQALLKAGRFKAALEDSDMALKLDKNSAASYVNRAMAKLNLGYPIAEVLADLKMAAELDPKRYLAFYERVKSDAVSGKIVNNRRSTMPVSVRKN